MSTTALKPRKQRVRSCTGQTPHFHTIPTPIRDRASNCDCKLHPSLLASFVEHDESEEYLASLLDSTPLAELDRTDCARILNLSSDVLDPPLKNALTSFRRHQCRSDWASSQKGMLDQISLLLTSSNADDRSLGYALAHCRPWRPCGRWRYCRWCRYLKRIVPWNLEFGDVFSKSDSDRVWLPLTVSFTSNWQKAGIHLVDRTDRYGRATKVLDLPYFLGCKGEMRPLGPDSEAAVELLIGVIYEFARLLNRAGWIDGAYVTHEVDLCIVPQEPSWRASDLWCDPLPHGHLIVNFRGRWDREFVPKWGLKVWHVFRRLCRRRGVSLAPDLCLGKVIASQRALDRCIAYANKPCAFERTYRKALKRGYELERVNDAFDDDAVRLVWIAQSSHRYTPRIGNLHSNDPGYIGRRIPSRQMMRSIQRKLKTIRDAYKRNLEPDWDFTDEEWQVIRDWQWVEFADFGWVIDRMGRVRRRRGMQIMDVVL